MSNYIVKIKRDDSLSILKHHGIKGQKWGRRRFQEDDGTLTEAGRKRYGVGDGDSDGDKTTSLVPSTGGLTNKINTPAGSHTFVPTEKAPTAVDTIKGLIPYTKLAKRDDDSKSDPNALVPYTKLAKRDEPDSDKKESFKPGDDGYEIKDAPKGGSKSDNTSKSKPDIEDVDFEDKTTPKKESFKPGDDGYEIHDAPKTDSKSDSDNTSKSKPDDIYDVKFKDKTGKTKTEKEAEEAHKRGEERAKEAEKNKKEGSNGGDPPNPPNNGGGGGGGGNPPNPPNKYNDQVRALSSAKSVADNASSIAKEMANIAGRKRVNVPRMDLSHMTNEQMQKAIQRDILERQYDLAFNTSRQKAEARKERTQVFLQNTGSALAVTASALGIALTVKKLIGK